MSNETENTTHTETPDTAETPATIMDLLLQSVELLKSIDNHLRSMSGIPSVAEEAPGTDDEVLRPKN